MNSLLSPREILEKLVAFPTVSDQSNLDLIGWVEAYLAGHGIASVRVPNGDGTKTALYAMAGPEAEGGVILSGHSDVVPVAGQDWTSDPFTLVERDGRLFGRGTCDMKGFVALAIAAMPLAARSGLSRPLQLAISYDEEVGCTGVAPMIAEMSRHFPRAAAAVIGEPSMMQAVTAHKASDSLAVHVRGHEVHSSILHRGASAVMEAARLIDWANNTNAASAAGPFSDIAAAFDPPWTTLHVGQISGGTADNITARDCRFMVTFRTVPSERPADWVKAVQTEAARIEAAMKAIHPDCAITVDHVGSVPPLAPESGGAAEALVRRLTGDNGRAVVSYATEAGHFQAGGYSAIVCGPGNIEQAHQPDEYMSVRQFERGWAFMQALVADLR